jgi:hypothetical protein
MDPNSPVAISQQQSWQGQVLGSLFWWTRVVAKPSNYPVEDHTARLIMVGFPTSKSRWPNAKFMSELLLMQSQGFPLTMYVLADGLGSREQWGSRAVLHARPCWSCDHNLAFAISQQL